MSPELIADYQCVIGENPLWHPDENQLYWLDIPDGRLFRYNPQTGEHENFYTHEGEIGGFTFQPDGSLLLFMSRGTIAIWKDGELTPVIDEISGELESRFNDVIADPVGRVFCGTMPQESCPGKLYQLDLDGSIIEILDSITCSNGLGFTPDLKQLYYTDSMKQKIYLFDYNQGTGSISNQRVFVTIPEKNGLPDGMTVDSEGYVWSAHWDGNCLVRFDPFGNEERRIEFPAKKVSSLCFGGEDLTDIYVTTAGGDNKLEEGTGAGALFRLNLGIQGTREFLSQINV